MKTLTAFLKNIYDTTFIHMYYFQNHQLLKSYPNVEMNFPFIEIKYQKLLNQNTDISYLFTTHQHYWGLIYKKETQEAILIGPAFLEQPSPNEIKEILYEYQMPTQDLYALQEFFQFIPKFSFHQFCSLLALVYRELLGQDLIFDAFLKEDKEERRQIANEHSLQITKAKEEEHLHNTYQYEQQYLHYIETGNIEGLKHFFSNPLFVQTGRVADNTLRQAKNLAVISTTLATRAAIKGGLSIENAYQLSDIYIQQSEKLQDIGTIDQLQYSMLLDFTNRVAQARYPKDISNDSYQAIQFIQKHTNRPLSVGDIAEHLGCSRSHLSRNFKKEVGTTLNEFIMQAKLEEAKQLLAYTDQPISEISNYLCFSSQSYFQNKFKQFFGVTPLYYRKHN